MAVIRFTSEFSTNEEAVNVWHFDCHGAASTTLANEAITKVDTFFEAIKGIIAPGFFTHGRRVTTVDLTPNIVVPATPLTTTATGVNNAPRSVAAGVSWTTAFIGKSYRGRSYIGPLTSSSLDSGGLLLGSSAVSLIAGALAAMYTPTAGGAVLAVWSPTLSVANDVVGATAHSGLRTQRRRLT